MHIWDYTYADLQKEKILIRQEDPIRYNVLTMILSGASALAKKDNRQVDEQDLVSAVKTEIRDSEKAIELIESKGGDASKQKAELAIYKSFMPAMLTEEQLKPIVEEWLRAFASSFAGEISKKNLGRLLGEFKSTFPYRSDLHVDSVDMKLVSKILSQLVG